MGNETSPLIYLAGPSVFRTDALDYALWLLELCRKYQLRGLCPIDIESDSAPQFFVDLLLIELDLLSFLPDFLDKRIGDAVFAVSSAHNEICVEELVSDRLDFFDLDVAPEHSGILSRRCCGEKPHSISLSPCDAFEDGFRQPAHIFHFSELNFRRHASDGPGNHWEELVWIAPCGQGLHELG